MEPSRYDCRQKREHVYESRFYDRPISDGRDLPCFRLKWLPALYPLARPEGVAAQFIGALFASHYLTVIFAVQVIGALLLLLNRFVPLALAVLAPVIVNILFFHALMAPSGLPLALFVALLWALAFVDVRSAFVGLFQSRVQARA